MSDYEILVLAPQGARREDLVRSLRDLGHSVRAADQASERSSGASGVEVVVVDARDAEPDWAALVADPWVAVRPMLVVIDRFTAALDALRGRPGGFALLTGRQSETGFQAALCICAALRPVEMQPGAS